MNTRLFIPLSIILGLLIGATSLFGLPRFTAQSEQKCNLCHVSPTGGGMRTGFGSQFFALTELAAHEASFEDIDKFQPQISNILALGMDMRTQYIYDESNELSSFFQMEGNLYISAQLDRRFSATFKKGLYSGFEIFGMGYILPKHGYFRIGKFQPAYGWRFADHTSFAREKMLWPANSTDTGIEFGIYPHGISANIGFFNGTGGVFDEGKGKAVSSRLEYRENIGGVGFGLGGSYYMADGSAGDRTMYGPLYYLKYGKLIIQGEIDWLEDKENFALITSFASTQKLAFMARRGIWFEFTYDFYDSNIDNKEGALTRYGMGIDYFPYGFLELEPMIRYYDDTSDANDDYILFNTQLHFFF
ncbi:MAG: hypothetical protein V3W18_13905 [candidate division Zixibacteria bacterium]